MANFAASKRKKVQRLVRFICSTLLFVLATSMVNKQEVTELPQAMPQVRVSCYTNAEQSTAERTMAHLYDERLAIPIYTAGELPGYHPTHSKHKCQQNILHPDRSSTLHASAGDSFHHRNPIYHHVIDYYIYTLEHILI